MDSLDIFERVREYWTETDVDILPPAAEVEIIDVFSRGGRLPVSRDVIRLYGTVGGFRDYSMDADANLSLWDLKKVRSDNMGYEGPEICFGDFLIGSHYFYLRFESDDHSSVLGGTHSPEVHSRFQGFGDESLFCCPSIAEFFERYIQDPFRGCHGWT